MEGRVTYYHSHRRPPWSGQGLSRLRGKHSQGHDAALYSVVGQHDDNDALKCNREIQRPENRGYLAYGIIRSGGDVQKDDLNSVQRKSHDVFKHYSLKKNSYQVNFF